MPDTKDFLNESTGRDSRSLVVRFQTPEAEIRVPFNDLSDVEKCFFISAVVLAANQSYGQATMPRAHDALCLALPRPSSH